MKKNIQQILKIIITNFVAVVAMNVFYVTSFDLRGSLVHLLLYMCLTYTLIILTKKITHSHVIVNVCEWLFGIINVLKIEIRGQDFIPWDLALIENTFDLAGFVQVSPEIWFSIFSQTFLIIAVTILQIYVFEENCEIPSSKGKIFIGVLSTIVLLFFPLKYKIITMKYIYPEEKGFANITRRGGTRSYGALFNFILELGVLEVEEVEGYSSEKISQIKKESEEYEFLQVEEYDNVILILMESFVDLEKVASVEFPVDSIPNYHKYQSKCINDDMNVDIIGGGTANVEYQVLTMHTVENYLDGIFPYIHYINEDVCAFPQVFKDNGYSTTAIHTYKEGFYNRDNVFELMGFDKYISDDDFENPEYYGEYIDDVEIYEKIVEILSEEEKSFIHAITMSAHTPYYKTMSYEETVYFSEEEYGRNAIGINNYLNSLRRTDKMLGELIEYIKGSDEKTLLIAYGDHFPSFPTFLGDIGVTQQNEDGIDANKYPQLYKTPYIVFSNIKSDKLESRGALKPNELGMYILQNVKLEKIPWIYKFYAKYFESKETNENYEMIQYDQIHGKKYWKEV